jgi:hypothetical protein
MRDPSSGTGRLPPLSTPACSHCSSAPKAKAEFSFLEWVNEFLNQHADLLTPSKHKTEGGQ